MSLILVVDDESDVEMLFRQPFRRELRAGRFRMDFALSADSALQCMSDVAAAGQMVRIRNSAAIAHQAAGRGEFAPIKNRGNCILFRQRDEWIAPTERECIGVDQKRAGPLLH